MPPVGVRHRLVDRAMAASINNPGRLAGRQTICGIAGNEWLCEVLRDTGVA